jgi:carbonic anhydrase/acetyltransferase-like protein (isoleucine patch superfamily)
VIASTAPVTHDFGWGPVPAHRHTNPDGTEGGWVADTATVAPTVYIGPDAQVYDTAWVSDSAWVYGSARVSDTAQVYGSARVYGSAWVSDSARVYDTAQVYGSARVSDSAWVYGSARVSDTAQVYGSARVYGSAWVSDSARVYDTRHVLTVGPVGSEDRHVTCHRTTDGHQIVAGCWTGTVEELRERVNGTPGEWEGRDAARWRADYLAVCDLFAGRIAEWAEVAS